MNIRKNNKKLMSRKYVSVSLLAMVMLGVLFGIFVMRFARLSDTNAMQVLSICVIVFVLVCIFLWLPLIIPCDQLMEIDEHAIYMMPKYNTMKSLKICWYTLINDDAKPFYRSIPIEEIEKIVFSFDAQWGSYAYQRFTFVLRIVIGKEIFNIYLNPGQNGPLMPSGHGVPFASVLTRADIGNLITFFRTNGVKVQDNYKLEDALKDESVVLYDYLVSLHKRIKF